MTAYVPKPGSVAFRALAHLELLHKGSEISNSMLAQQLSASGPEVLQALEPARKAGMVFSRQKGGHIRSPIFWSLEHHPDQSAPTNEIPRPEVHSPVTARGEAAPAAQPTGNSEHPATPKDGGVPDELVRELSTVAQQHIAAGLSVDAATAARSARPAEIDPIPQFLPRGAVRAIPPKAQELRATRVFRLPSTAPSLAARRISVTFECAPADLVRVQEFISQLWAGVETRT